jgi:hypothetical protein
VRAVVGLCRRISAAVGAAAVRRRLAPSCARDQVVAVC